MNQQNGQLKIEEQKKADEEAQKAEERQQEEESQQAQADLEAEAEQDGWVPKDKFKGDEADWIDAAAFVKRGKEINPILRKNNQRLLRELATAKSEIAELKLTTKEFGEMYKTMSENAYKRAIADLKTQARAARKDGDDELAEDLTEQREKLEEEAKNIKVPGTGKDAGAVSRKAELDAIQVEWQNDNPWFDPEKNPDLFHMAEGVALRLAQSAEGKALVGTRGFLDKVSELTKKMVPDRFKNPRRTSGSPVGSSSGTRSSSEGNGGKKSYADLPPEAKAACDRQVKSIPGFTRDKYVGYYFEQKGV